MKYLILIWSNPESRKLWESFSAEARAAGLGAYERLTASLSASGELVAAEALADVSRAKRIHRRGARTTATDGPFAEAKEYLAGLILVRCDSIDRAIAIAGEVPEAEYGLVEVRPCMDLSEFET